MASSSRRGVHNSVVGSNNRFGGRVVFGNVSQHNSSGQQNNFFVPAQTQVNHGTRGSIMCSGSVQVTNSVVHENDGMDVDLKHEEQVTINGRTYQLRHLRLCWK